MRAPILSIVASLTLSGCLLGPNYERPAVEMPATFRFAESDAKDLVNTAWWSSSRTRR
jgi:multidrug efflux system outer membrane protein